jgi:hypothetical protein
VALERERARGTQLLGDVGLGPDRHGPRTVAHGDVLVVARNRDVDDTLEDPGLRLERGVHEEIEQQLVQGTSMRQMAFEIPWVFEGVDPARVQGLLAPAPFLAKVLYRLLFVRQYRRIAGPVSAPVGDGAR